MESSIFWKSLDQLTQRRWAPKPVHKVHLCLAKGGAAYLIGLLTRPRSMLVQSPLLHKVPSTALKLTNLFVLKIKGITEGFRDFFFLLPIITNKTPSLQLAPNPRLLIWAPSEHWFHVLADGRQLHWCLFFGEQLEEEESTIEPWGLA